MSHTRTVPIPAPTGPFTVRNRVGQYRFEHGIVYFHKTVIDVAFWGDYESARTYADELGLEVTRSKDGRHNVVKIRAAGLPCQHENTEATGEASARCRDCGLAFAAS